MSAIITITRKYVIQTLDKKKFMIGFGNVVLYKKGNPGADGREIEVQLGETYIQWRYIGDENWINLIAIADLKGTDGITPVKGVDYFDGTNGDDGREIELQKGDTYIQWRYAGDEDWINLILIADLKGTDGDDGITPVKGVDYFDGTNGDDGREIELQKGDTYIQWRYAGDEDWSNLILIADLKGEPGEDGNNSGQIELQKGETYIQWRYVGDENWIDLIAIADLQGDKGDDGTTPEKGVDYFDGADGDNGREIELQKGETYIQWRYIGDENWTNLILIADLKGSDGDDGITPEKGVDYFDGVDGDDGREIELQKGETYIQWRYAGEESWTNLIAIADLKGNKGDDGVTPVKGVDYFDGADGDDGREIELQKGETYIQWRYAGEESWINLIAIADLKGMQGDAGPNNITTATTTNLTGILTGNGSIVGYIAAPSGAVVGISDTQTLTNKTLTDPKIHAAINPQTGITYTFVLTDDGKYVTFGNAAAITVTVPQNSSVGFPVGTQIACAQILAGKVTFAPDTNVTINARSGYLSLAGQWAGCTLVKTDTNIWLLVGDMIS